MLHTTCYAMHSAVAHLSFFFKATATTEIYTLSLHDALPISLDADGGGYGRSRERRCPAGRRRRTRRAGTFRRRPSGRDPLDRKSTRLNSSHSQISYAVFCLKKKKHTDLTTYPLSKHILLLHI